MSLQQRVLHFSGNVQGVGFRFIATRTARRYDVTGYVRNMPDGRVECVVEGQKDEIDAFEQELTGAMSSFISEVSRNDAPYSGGFDDFSVRF